MSKKYIKYKLKSGMNVEKKFGKKKSKLVTIFNILSIFINNPFSEIIVISFVNKFLMPFHSIFTKKKLKLKFPFYGKKIKF